MQSDEELFLNKTDLAQALISKMGVCPENRKEKHSTAQNDGIDVNAVDEAATETFRKAQSLWRVPKLQQDHIQHSGLTMDAARCKPMRQFGRASQKQELQANVQKPESNIDSTFRASHKYSIDTISEWLTEVRNRKNKKGKALVRKTQMEVL